MVFPLKMGMAFAAGYGSISKRNLCLGLQCRRPLRREICVRDGNMHGQGFGILRGILSQGANEDGRGHKS